MPTVVATTVSSGFFISSRLHGVFYPIPGYAGFPFPTHAGFVEWFTSPTRWCLPVCLQHPYTIRMEGTPKPPWSQIQPQMRRQDVTACDSWYSLLARFDHFRNRRFIHNGMLRSRSPPAANPPALSITDAHSSFVTAGRHPRTDTNAPCNCRRRREALLP